MNHTSIIHQLVMMMVDDGITAIIMFFHGLDFFSGELDFGALHLFDGIRQVALTLRLINKFYVLGLNVFTYRHSHQFSP